MYHDVDKIGTDFVRGVQTKRITVCADVNASSVFIILCTSGDSPVTSRGVWKENVGAVMAQQYVMGGEICREVWKHNAGKQPKN